LLVKCILYCKKERIRWAWNYHKDVKRMFGIARNESNRLLKTTYYILPIGYYSASIACFLIFSLFAIRLIFSNQCSLESQFKKLSLYGIIVEKYFDEKNHGSATI